VPKIHTPQKSLIDQIIDIAMKSMPILTVQKQNVLCDVTIVLNSKIDIAQNKRLKPKFMCAKISLATYSVSRSLLDITHSF
jgi:hypothetical protein